MTEEQAPSNDSPPQNPSNKAMISLSINAAIQNAAANAIDTNTIIELLHHKATVDDVGNILINGKDAKGAVADLLREKPFLAKPSGALGSGSSRVSLFDVPSIPSNLSAVDRVNLYRTQGTK